MKLKKRKNNDNTISNTKLEHNLENNNKIFIPNTNNVNNVNTKVEKINTNKHIIIQNINYINLDKFY
jgi:hypothetical protein